MYFIFFPQTIDLAIKKNIQYFNTIFSTFINLLKKFCNNDIDITFCSKNILEIKKANINTIKMTNMLSSHTYLKTNYEAEDDVFKKDRDLTKNLLCELILKLLNKMNSSFSYGQIRPVIPSIFFGSDRNSILTERKAEKLQNANIQKEKESLGKLGNFEDSINKSNNTSKKIEKIENTDLALTFKLDVIMNI